MAADSLFGGSTDLSHTLSAASLQLINQFLTDTVGGSATTSAFGGSTLVLGTGSAGEQQGALLPSSAAISGTIHNGLLTLNVSLPGAQGLVFEGKDNVGPETVQSYLSAMIDAYLPSPLPGSPQAAMHASLTSAVDDLVSSIKALGVTEVVVRVVDFLAPSSGTAAAADVQGTDVLFDGSGTSATELLVFNLAHLNPGETLVLKGVQNALAAGAGTVRVEGSTPVRITSDASDQKIIGGDGNDTLIGGGGHDTLTGGSGNDVFAFARIGHFEITDFSAGDKIAFNVPGVTSVGQLMALVTSVEESAQGVTFHFGQDASITLIGHSAADITAGMVQFSF